ncbi:MAG: response regulator [Nitrospinota bacterium]|nr:response regulator [Nitrospinota bacterium]
MMTKHTVLYVEDDPDSIMLVENAFERLPQVNLVTATDGAEGLKIAQNTVLHLIILDINLPDIDGYEILKRLQKLSVVEGIPVIAYTSMALLQEKQKGLKAGFTDYLSKPMRLKDFISAIKGHLSIQEPGAASQDGNPTNISLGSTSSTRSVVP